MFEQPTAASEDDGNPQSTDASPGKLLVQSLVTHNPFYLISVACVLHGTGLTLQDDIGLQHPWLLTGLISGYVLMMATAAFGIVRWGKVWDDARSIFLILLVLFVQLAFSFDQLLTASVPGARTALFLGLFFCMFVCEGLLWGLRIRLPLTFRGPLYGMLALIYLYPLVLIDVPQPVETNIPWRIIGFSWASAAIILTLLPAIRRGATGGADNGTPWSWPWFPWSIVGTLIVGLGVRSYALTLSFDPVLSLGLDAAMQLESVFGGYFLVPIVLAVSLLIVEAGLVSGKWSLQRGALLLPVFALVLSASPGAGGRPYQEFVAAFSQTMGTPLFTTALLCAVYYGYCCVRRLEGAQTSLIAWIALLTVVSPATTGWNSMGPLQPIPLLSLAGILLVTAVRQGQSLRAALALLTVLVALNGGFFPWGWQYRQMMTLYCAAAGILLIGVCFRDVLARGFRDGGVFLMLVINVVIVVSRDRVLPGVDDVYVAACGMGVFATLLGVAHLCRNWGYLLAMLASLLINAGGGAWTGYAMLKRQIAWQGMDSYFLGIVCLLVAIGVSAVKAGAWQKVLSLWIREPSQPESVAD